MFSDARPFDWIMLAVEVLVLGLIAYEIFIGIVERKETRKRKLLVNQRMAEMREAMEQGHKLQQSVPFIGDAGVDPWYQSTKRWTHATQLMLRSYSSQAEASFMDLSDTPLVSDYQRKGDPITYVELLVRRKNLRQVMEKPEVYF